MSTAAATSTADDKEWERMVMSTKTPNNTPTKYGDDSDVVFVSAAPPITVVSDKH